MATMSAFLPPDYSAHGPEIDTLFRWIAILTLPFLLLVHGLLVFAAIRYRRAAGRAISSSKGDVRLELLWTIVPAVLLIGTAICSERVWARYRTLSQQLDPSAATILVIGQQFKWNIIYPGADGMIGRYLNFPKPTDGQWPHRENEPNVFRGCVGPASLPPSDASAAINDFIAQPDPAFQLGQDFSDPAGKDDQVEDAVGRPLYLPLNRPVKIVLMSRDVIHDFYLPTFRTQLYAVPGLTGSLALTATHLGDCGELICGQLCGVGHALMHTPIVVLPANEYHRRFEENP